MQALDALEQCDAVETERLVARERMADLLGPTGRRGTALDEYKIVETGYRAAGDAPGHARILRKGQLDHLAVPLIVLGQIYQCPGEPTRAIAHYREALALAEAADEPQLLFPCYDGLATAHLDLGDDGRAEEFMQKAQAVCERAGLEPDALVVPPFLD